MDQFLVALISPIVGILGSLVISGFGIAVGASARYGLPSSYRRGGGRILAVLGGALMLALVVGASIEQPTRAGWLYAATILAVWFPGFAAASLGASRWILAGSVPMGMVLAYATSLSFLGIA